MAFSQQVNLKSYMNKASKNNINVPKDTDEAHNVKEALSHKSRMANVGAGKLGKTGNGGTSYISGGNGAMIYAKPSSKVKSNPIKKCK